MFLFFFFKQKTAYEIYQCDWSSDVCSSDLQHAPVEVQYTRMKGFVPPACIQKARQEINSDNPITRAKNLWKFELCR